MPVRLPPQTRVILIPSDNQRTREYVIGRGLLITLLALTGALAALLVVALTTWSVLATRAAQVPSLQKRLAEASEQVAQVRVLTREMEQMRGVQRQVYTLLGVPEPAALAGPDAGGAAATAGAGAGAPGAPAGAAAAAGGQSAGAAAAAIGRPGPGLAGASLGLIALPPPDLWPVKGRATREFAAAGGSGSAPGGAHEGIDLAAAVDTPIKAAGKGVVTRAGWDPFLGNYVEIAHGLGYVTVYGHCSRLAAREGDRVDRGQEIAFLGGTGQATAPHLHFEVWKNGAALDPRLVMTGDPAR